MRYSLLISDCDANATQGLRALGFAEALQRRGHQVSLVFFFADGVNAAVAARDAARWQALATQAHTELILCSASAERIGVSEPPAGLAIAGLGALIEVGCGVDRVINFV